MLCPRCDSERHRMWLETQSASASHSCNDVNVDRGAATSGAKEKSPLTTSAPDTSTKSSKSVRIGAVSTRATDMTTRSSSSSKSDDVVKTDKLVICELLFFTINNVDKHPLEAIKTVISEFYREDEIMTAKHVLIQALPQI